MNTTTTETRNCDSIDIAPLDVGDKLNVTAAIEQCELHSHDYEIAVDHSLNGYQIDWQRHRLFAVTFNGYDTVVAVCRDCHIIVGMESSPDSADSSFVAIDPTTGDLTAFDDCEDFVDAGGDLQKLRDEAGAAGDRDLVATIDRYLADDTDSDSDSTVDQDLVVDNATDSEKWLAYCEANNVGWTEWFEAVEDLPIAKRTELNNIVAQMITNAEVRTAKLAAVLRD